MLVTRVLLICTVICASGCATMRNPQGVALRTGTAGVSLNKRAGGFAATASTSERDQAVTQLEADFELAKVDMRKALSFITTGQVKDYTFRKNVGFAGVLLGAAATTLNAASKANIVTSTAFTAVQTGVTGYLGTSDGLVNPNSNQQLTETKKAIEDAYKDFLAQLGTLQTPGIGDDEWKAAFVKAKGDLGTINFQAFSVLPSDS